MKNTLTNSTKKNSTNSLFSQVVLLSVLFAFINLSAQNNYIQLSVDTLSSTYGFSINGETSGDQAGNSVSKAGDVNGDGIDDVIVGAHNADPGGISNAGKSYVVFGSNSNLSDLNLNSLNGSNGFEILGILDYFF